MRVSGSVFLLFFAAGSARAATYYVATTGSDAHSCLEAQNQTSPHRTIDAGIACLAGGDTLSIKAGTYDESISYAREVPNGSGSGDTYSSPTVIQGFGTDKVVINGIHCGSPSAGKVREYVIFKNLIIEGGGVSFGGGANGGYVRYMKLDGLEVRNVVNQNYGVGIFMGGADGSGSHLWVTNTVVHDGGISGYGHCYYVEGSNNVIENSQCYNWQAYGIHNYSQDGVTPSNNIYRNNIIHHAGVSDARTAFGILLSIGTNNVAYNNLVFDNQGGIAAESGNFVYNNTLVRNGKGHAGECCYEAILATAAVVKNNIVFGNAIDAITNTGGTSANNLIGDPGFVNAAGGDFHLQARSPAIDTGASVGEVKTDFDGVARPQGAAFDIGAYEYTDGSTAADAGVSARDSGADAGKADAGKGDASAGPSDAAANGAGDADTGADTADPNASAQGCGCRLGTRPSGGPMSLCVLALLLLRALRPRSNRI